MSKTIISLVFWVLTCSSKVLATDDVSVESDYANGIEIVTIHIAGQERPPVITQEEINSAVSQISQAESLDQLHQVVNNLRTSLPCPTLSTFMTDTEIRKYPHLEQVIEALWDRECKIQQRGRYRPSGMQNFMFSTQSGMYGMFYGLHQLFQILLNK